VVFERIDKGLKPWHVITFLAIAVGLGAIMGLSTVPHIRDIAVAGDAVQIFDLQFGGYHYEEALAVLAGLGEEAQSYYGAPHLILDTLFLPFLFLGVTSLFLWLTRPGQRFAVPLHENIRLVVVALAFVGMISDLMENIGVWIILGTADEPSTGIVAMSGIFTGVKWLALSGAMAALVATIIIALIRGVSTQEPARA
jgi:hypothetical protein